MISGKPPLIVYTCIFLKTWGNRWNIAKLVKEIKSFLLSKSNRQNRVQSLLSFQYCILLWINYLLCSLMFIFFCFHYNSSPQELWEHPEREPLPVQKALEETSKSNQLLFYIQYNYIKIQCWTHFYCQLIFQNNTLILERPTRSVPVSHWCSGYSEMLSVYCNSVGYFPVKLEKCCLKFLAITVQTFQDANLLRPGF
jgi:hypothetical protein